MLGRRLNEYRNGFALPTDIQLPNLYESDVPSVMGHVESEDVNGREYGTARFQFSAERKGNLTLTQTPQSTGTRQYLGCAQSPTFKSGSRALPRRKTSSSPSGTDWTASSYRTTADVSWMASPPR